MKLFPSYHRSYGVGMFAAEKKGLAKFICVLTGFVLIYLLGAGVLVMEQNYRKASE